FVDTSILEAVMTLAILNIFRLPAQDGAVRSISRWTALTGRCGRTTSTRTSWTRRRRRRTSESQFHFQQLATSLDFQLDLVVDLVGLHLILDILVGMNRLVADGNDDVIGLEPGFLGGGFFDHPEDESPGVADGVFARQTH